MKREEFASKLRSKYPGAYDSLDDNELVDKVIAKYPQYASQVDSSEQPASVSDKSFMRSAAERVVNSPAIPMVAGIGAGLASAPLGPGAIGVAGLAGAGAEGYRQLLARSMGLPTPQTSLDAAKEIGIQGVSQAAGEAGGQVIGKVANLPPVKSAIESVTKPITNAAVASARRALGFSKRFLNTAFARREATQAARVALEKDVIPFLGSPSTMMENASRLAGESGSEITSTLNKIGFEKIAPNAERDLETFRQVITKGTDKGLFAGANPVIDNVKTTILELYGRGATASEYNQAKNALAQSINYLSDAGSQNINKRTVRTMANTVRETVAKLLPDDYPKFLENQRIFNASANMMKGLNNELAAQMGNNVLSLPSLIIGGGAATIGSGGPNQNAQSRALHAVEALGAYELLKRRGPGMAARGLYKLAPFAKSSLGFAATKVIPRIGQASLGFAGQKALKTKEESQ